MYLCIVCRNPGDMMEYVWCVGICVVGIAVSCGCIITVG